MEAVKADLVILMIDATQTEQKDVSIDDLVNQELTTIFSQVNLFISWNCLLTEIRYVCIFFLQLALISLKTA
jgi:hypothetical protein